MRRNTKTGPISIQTSCRGEQEGPGEDDEEEDLVMKGLRDDVDRRLDDGWSRGSRIGARGHGAGVLDAGMSASMITNRSAD